MKVISQFILYPNAKYHIALCIVHWMGHLNTIYTRKNSSYGPINFSVRDKSRPIEVFYKTIFSTIIVKPWKQRSNGTKSPKKRHSTDNQFQNIAGRLWAQYWANLYNSNQLKWNVAWREVSEAISGLETTDSINLSMTTPSPNITGVPIEERRDNGTLPCKEKIPLNHFPWPNPV